MRSRIIAAVVPIGVVVFAWASLESDPDLTVFGAIAILSLLASVPGRVRDRMLVAAAVALGLTLVLAGTSPTALREQTRHGLSDVYAVPAPFDAIAHHEMHVLVALTAALFCLAIAVTAPSRPLLAAGVTIAGVGWPVMILPGRKTVAVGALAVLAAFWPQAIRRARRTRARIEVPLTCLPGCSRRRGEVLREACDGRPRLAELGSLHRRARGAHGVPRLGVQRRRDRLSRQGDDGPCGSSLPVERCTGVPPPSRTSPVTGGSNRST